MKLAYKVFQVSAPLAGLLFIVMWMSGHFGEKIEPTAVPTPRERAPADAVVVVAEKSVTPVIEEVAGTIEAARKTAVSSRIMAVVREVMVGAGDQVRAGQTLIVLDDRDLVARRQEAKGTLEAARATAGKAKSDFDRAKELFAKRVISQSEFDQAASAYEVAKARVATARESLEAAEVASTFAQIQAPIDGRVVDRLVEPGDTASPGRPLILLYDPSALRIEAAVRESIATRLEVGQELSVRVGSPQKTLPGTIDEIVPQAETGSRTFLVKVGLPRHEGIFTGMFGRLLIPIGERERILLPQRAVASIGQLAFVSVVDSEGYVSRRLVTLGAKAGDDRVEVLSGVRPGTRILLP